MVSVGCIYVSGVFRHSVCISLCMSMLCIMRMYICIVVFVPVHMVGVYMCVVCVMSTVILVALSSSSSIVKQGRPQMFT